MAQVQRSIAAESQAKTLAPPRMESVTKARQWSIRGIAGKIGFWILIAFILIYTLFPFYWAIVSSLTPGSRLFDTPVRYWPADVTFDNYREIFEAEFFR